MLWKDVDGESYDVIPKSDLENGVYYVGVSRIGHVALWSDKHQFFYLINYSFGIYSTDNLPYPGDESSEREEVFRPLKKVDKI